MSFIYVEGLGMVIKEEVEETQEMYNSDVVYKLSRFWNEAFFDVDTLGFM